jgi:hypothetical protein
MSVKVRAYKRGGWEVDIVVRLPSGEEVRERRKSPTTSKSASLRWGQERERVLLFERPPEPEKEVPTFKEFTPRYMSDYVRANRLKPSTVESQESILRVHLADRFDDRRLDRITDEDVQRLKGDLAKRSAKTANNVLSVLNTMLKAAVTWKVIDAMPCTIRPPEDRGHRRGLLRLRRLRGARRRGCRARPPHPPRRPPGRRGRAPAQRDHRARVGPTSIGSASPSPFGAPSGTGRSRCPRVAAPVACP